VGSVRSESVQKYVRGKKPHIIISSIEHAAIIETAKILSESGEASVSYLPVDNEGIVLVQELKKMLRPETVLVSVMYANNEIGTIQPIREIAKTLRHARKEKGMFPLLHTDATQAGNYLPLRIPPLGVDLMTLNSSKIYGPKGVGALFVRDGIILSPLMHGGIQEGGFRPGTENVAGCVAFSRALAITQSMMKKESERLSSLQNFFFNELSKAFPDSVINGSRALRLPNNVHVSFPEISSETLTLYLDARGIYVSEKSACKASMEEPSHVITALGKNTGMGSIRFSMGRSTTRNDIKRTIAALKDIRALIGKAPLAR
jgi:cysteine desulfurase